MTSEPESELPPALPDKATIIRDALVLQAKLVVDGLRDALLIPVSFFAAIISVLLPGGETRLFFYEVVRSGRRSERWINLFAAADKVFPDDDAAREVAGLDDLLEQVESQLRRQSDGGDEGQSSQEAARSILHRIKMARRRFGAGSSGTTEK